ncbi:hypothetical protein WJX82_008287 [Trebouxia sp. C0006]
MCSRACPSLFWQLHNSRRRAPERQFSVKLGSGPPGLGHYALRVEASGKVALSIAGCLLQDAEYKNYQIREDTRQLKLKTALCMQATSGLGNALSKCHITHEDFEQACIHLAELVEEYEPELMRLPGNAPKHASAQAVQRAKVILLNNSPSQFLGHALGQIAAASQGKMVQNFVMESCDEGTRCFEIAEVLKDFKQDFLEADIQALKLDADRMAASNAVLQQRAEGAEAAQAALQQRTEDAEAAKATLEEKVQAADDLCSSVQMSLHESEQAMKSLRCQLNEQEQVAQSLQADSENLQAQLRAEQEHAGDAEQRAQLLKSQLQIEEQKTVNLVATLGEEHAQTLQAVQGELSTANSKLADSEKDAARHGATPQAFSQAYGIVPQHPYPQMAPPLTVSHQAVPRPTAQIPPHAQQAAPWPSAQPSTLQHSMYGANSRSRTRLPDFNTSYDQGS